MFWKSLRDRRTLPWGLADGQNLWSITADRYSNNCKQPGCLVALHRTWEMWEFWCFFCKSLQTCINDELFRLLIPLYYTVVSSVVAQCGWSCRHNRHSKGTFSFLDCYEINNSDMALWPTGTASLLLIGYDLVFAWDGSFLITSNYFTVNTQK